MDNVRQISAAVDVVVICKRRKRKRKAKEVWEREWLKRTERGVYRQLLEELRLEDEENYRRYLRMDTKTFQAKLNGFPYQINKYGTRFGAVFLNVGVASNNKFTGKRKIPFCYSGYQCLLAAEAVIHKFPKFDRIRVVTDQYMVLISCYFALAEK